MSALKYTPDDFVLRVQDDSEKVLDVVYKYDSFLDAITTSDFKHLRDATREVIRFFVSEKYQSTEDLAREAYNSNKKIETHNGDLTKYLNKFFLKERKFISVDLATGAGKSWVIYAVAQIMLAEGLVDKVLVLCPSLTIEEELKNKFEELSGDSTNQKVLKELGAVYSNPSIKSANDPILGGDICVENIHAVYERTGSSIEDSFKEKGQRTLVISDEAHHIYSGTADTSSQKKWSSFLENEEYGFHYHLGLTGTPYMKDGSGQYNEYFPDIVYRFSLREAIDNNIVKKPDYKLEDGYEDKWFEESYQNHTENVKKYAGVLEPISIVITDKIVTCVEVWSKLVEYISKKENISKEKAQEKVIWVASGISSGKEKENIESLVENPEKIRKENLQKLKTVDENDSSVEWIVSVAMLTEGWDVKNVFQIVPHERRAFNSKLLISQVLGRGLRIPKDLEGEEVLVKINNHEAWTEKIENLYKDILEIENRVRWGVVKNKEEYIFPLHNAEYNTEKYTEEIKRKVASAPSKVTLKPQHRQVKRSAMYKESGTMSFVQEIEDNISIESALLQIKLFLNEKDTKISKKYTKKKIRDYIVKSLRRAGQPENFISRENLMILKQSFGPMFRDVGKKTPRLRSKADSVFQVDMKEMPQQSFSESAFKSDGHVYFTDNTLSYLNSESAEILKDELKKKKVFEKEEISEDNFKYLENNFHKIDESNFKCPQSLVFVSHNPERKFTQKIFDNVELIDSFVKSPDKGFYSIPYSYKPTEIGGTHVQQRSFNPDFFIKLEDKNIVLVVEIKDDQDIKQKNKAKQREALKHFDFINERQNEIEYHFFFLSPEDYDSFFQTIREGGYKEWKSRLMQDLEK